jgi:hypothetical protein
VRSFDFRKELSNGNLPREKKSEDEISNNNDGKHFGKQWLEQNK